MNLTKNIRRIFATVLVLFLTAFVVGFFIVRSHSFHQYVLVKMVEKTAEATGGKVEIGDYRFHWFPLRADIYRLVIHGTEPNPAEPLFASDHLGIGLKIISLLERKVDLREMVIDHPVVHLFVDPSGHTNIPPPRVAKEGGTPANVFDLAIKRFQVQGGELYFNDRQLPLDAELHDLEAQAQFDPVQTQYNGSLSYHKGRLHFADLNPLQHDFEAGFTASPSGLNVDHILVATASSRLSARGIMKEYSNPAIEGTYQATLSMQEVKNILRAAPFPVGGVSVIGALRYQNAPGQPFLKGLLVEGRFSSSALALRTAEAHAEMRAVRGRYHLEKGVLEASDVQADLLNGHLSAELRMRLLTNNPESYVTGTFRAISLNELNASLGTKPLEAVPMSGQLDGKFDATWHGTFLGLQVRTDATIAANAEAASSATSKESTIPLNGTLHLAYDGARNTLLVNQTRLQTPHTTVLLNGAVSDHSLLNIQVSNDDLREVDILALGLRRAIPRPSFQPQLLGLTGSASYTGQISGSMKEPRFTGQLKADNFQVQGISGRVLQTGLNVSASEIGLHRGDLETNTHGRIRFDVTAGLYGWSYIPTNPIKAQVSLTRIPIADLEHLFKLQYPMTGLMSGDISVRGSQTNPEGKGSVQLTAGNLWNQPVRSLSLRFEGTGESVHLTMAAQTSAGNATGNITYFPKKEGYEGEIEARDVRLDQVQWVQGHNLGLKGVMTVSAKGSGTIKSPQIKAVVEIPELQIRDQKISALKAQIDVANEQATLALDSKITEAYIKINGNVQLKPDYYATATVDSRGIPLGPVLASYLPGQFPDLRGETEVHGSLKGPLKDPARLEAHVEIPTLNVGYQSLQIHNAAPIQLDYKNSVLTLHQTQIKGTGIDLQLQATVPLQGQGLINASAMGTADLRLIQFLDPELNGSGEVRLDITARGNRSRPSVQGEVRVSNGAIQVSNAPLGLERMNGEFAVQNTRVEIRQLSGQIGGGSVSAQGYVTYRPDIQFHLGLTANSVRLRYPEGVRALLNGKLAMNGAPDSSELSGQVVVERLSFTRSFDLATFLNQFSVEPSPSPGSRYARNLKLNVAVQSTEELGLESAKLSLQGSANLRVRGTLAEPVVLGRANLTGGELFFLGNRYQVQRGVVDFANPVRTQPVINLQVTTTVNQYNLSLNFVGPIERFRTTYTSDPPLPLVDIINLLAFGKTTGAAAASASTPASLGAESVLAQGLSSQLSSRVEKFAGISHLSINPLIGGNQRNPGARLAVQQRITKNLLFTFATDVTSTQGETVQIEYQVSPKWSVSVVRNQNGGVAVDAKMRKTF